MRNRIVAAAAALLLVTAEDSTAQIQRFAQQWAGPDANAVGFITLDVANVTNPGQSDNSFDAFVTDFELSVTGAYSGNGTFTFADYDGIDTPSAGTIELDTGDTALDFTRELVGQPTDGTTWGALDSGNGSFLLIRDLGSQAPARTGPFVIITWGGSDLLALTSLRPALCGDAPAGAPDCRTAQGSRLVIKDKDTDSLKWQWTGEGFEQADLGDPAADTYYSLCIYDETASVPVLAAELGINRGDGWINNSPRGLDYEHDGSSFGVTRVRIRTATDGRTSVKLHAGTEVLRLPAPLGMEFFDQDASVTVQLVSSEGTCWSASYAAENTSSNKATLFKAQIR